MKGEPVPRTLIWGTVLLLLTSGVQAAVFEWTDDKGVVHFTDNPERVPAKYRHKARERESISGETSATAPESPQQAVPAPAPPAPVKPELYGGHDLDWWRNEYRTLTKAISAATDDLAKAKEDLGAARRKKMIFERTRDREGYVQRKTDVEARENRLADLQKRLADLESAAARAGVPPRWQE
jgi:hypothetical protein